MKYFCSRHTQGIMIFRLHAFMEFYALSRVVDPYFQVVIALPEVILRFVKFCFIFFN